MAELTAKRLDENGNVRQEFYEYALQCCKDGIEIWADIDKYEGLYQVSNMGRIINLERKVLSGQNIRTIKSIILKPVIIRGYFYVSLSSLGDQKLFRIHRISAQSFIPNPENKPQVNHIFGIKTRNELTHLEWATQSENMLHACRTGLRITAKGKNSKSSKFVSQFDKNGIHIRDFSAQNEASKLLNIKQGLISSACYGKQKCAGGFIWKFKNVV